MDAVDRLSLPECLRYYPDVKVHVISYDPTRCAGGLSLLLQNYSVQQTVSAATHKAVYGTEGFEQGVHYWSFKIIDRATNGYIMIGVSDGLVSCTTSDYPGCVSGSHDVALYLANGHRYFSATNGAMPQVDLIKRATHVGVLLNMKNKTCSFFADGILLGMGAGSDILTSKKYFPLVTVYELGQTICSDVLVNPLQQPDSSAPVQVGQMLTSRGPGR